MIGHLEHVAGNVSLGKKFLLPRILSIAGEQEHAQGAADIGLLHAWKAIPNLVKYSFFRM